MEGETHEERELEVQILRQAKSAVAKAINDELTGYNKPLTKLTQKVIDRHEDRLLRIFDNAMDRVLSDDGLEEEIFEAFNHKLARTLVSQLEGSVDKAANEIKNNPRTKAKMILAIENIIEGRSPDDGEVELEWDGRSNSDNF